MKKILSIFALNLLISSSLMPKILINQKNSVSNNLASRQELQEEVDELISFLMRASRGIDTIYDRVYYNILKFKDIFEHIKEYVIAAPNSGINTISENIGFKIKGVNENDFVNLYTEQKKSSPNIKITDKARGKFIMTINFLDLTEVTDANDQSGSELIGTIKVNGSLKK